MGAFVDEHATDHEMQRSAHQPHHCAGADRARHGCTHRHELRSARSQNGNPEGLATPPLRDATLTLPQGFTVNPSSAGGLVGCTPAQIDVESNEPGGCPLASQIGEVEVRTPLLDHPLPGKVYLGSPECSPCTNGDAEAGRLIKLYIEINDPQSGVVVKLPGSSAITSSGQLQATFAENPQLPFEDLKLNLKSGPRAPLTTPLECGEYTTASDLEPWSAPETPNATPSSAFKIDEGCGARGFAPSFSAGTVNNQAGGYSTFTTSFSRTDGDQYLSGITLTTPPGLLGAIKNVPLCPEPLAEEGKCGAESQIGETTATVGAGPDPYQVTGGTVYLTGPYNGGPFGLSVVVPAVAGPFNLGNVIVRASIRVNPTTAQISILSNPLPSVLDGIPLQIKTVDVAINRQSFMFNPTDCSELGVGGAITSTQGASAGVSSPFEAANCAGLPFKPSLTASTSGRTSRVGGASFVVKVSQKPGEANIHRVDLQLPAALPARLSTLQKACTEAQFNANPAGCPAASVIGTATARTPILQAPLTGPAYVVSHGNAAFPDVEFVLQADERGGEVEIVLDGGTQIKKGITYSRFETVPDAPISSFETVLPEGPHSVLAAQGSLCAMTSKKTVKVRKRVRVVVHGRVRHIVKTVKRTVTTPPSLPMPTTIVGQNGAVVEQSTRVAVTECPKTKER